MMSRLKQLIKGNRGQAMIAALVCMALGGLIIAPLIGYTGTSMKGVSLKKSGMLGLYAADAGIEDALWALKYGQPLPTSLPQSMNGANVTINTVSKGNYTLVAGEWESTNSHTTDLIITTSMVWDSGHNAYKYTVTANWTGSGLCKLIEVGARLPIGYSYEAGSAALFGGNLSLANPNPNALDEQGAYEPTWKFSQTTITVATQTFYVTGSGDLEGDYGWAEASRDDVGETGQLTGAFYIITATATKSGALVGKVEANVMVSGSNVDITSYRILR